MDHGIPTLPQPPLVPLFSSLLVSRLNLMYSLILKFGEMFQLELPYRTEFRWTKLLSGHHFWQQVRFSALSAEILSDKVSDICLCPLLLFLFSVFSIRKTFLIAIYYHFLNLSFSISRQNVNSVEKIYSMYRYVNYIRRNFRTMLIIIYENNRSDSTQAL